MLHCWLMIITIILDEGTEQMLRDIVDEVYRQALVFFKTKSLFRATIPHELNYGFQQWLTFGHVTAERIDTILALFSPFKDAGGQAIFNVYYPKGSNEINGRIPNDFNGGYHTLASLYAALGDTVKCYSMF